MALALACDIRLAADSASLVPAFVGIGLVPDSGLSHTLPRIIGPAAAFEWLVTGEKLSAEQARARGLVSRVVPAAELRRRLRRWRPTWPPARRGRSR